MCVCVIMGVWVCVCGSESTVSTKPMCHGVYVCMCEYRSVCVRERV